jgi:hypothetical protein
MKITTDHLEKVRTLLGAASEQLAVQSKVARESEEARLALDGRVRGLQGAFDICAAAYAGDVEPSEAQLGALPEAVKAAIGYVAPPPPEPAAAA